MSSRVLEHSKFLLSILRSPRAIRKASVPQIAIIVEILSNLNKIPLSNKERQSLLPLLPVIRIISSVRSAEKARELLIKFAPYIIPQVVPAVIEFANKK